MSGGAQPAGDAIGLRVDAFGRLVLERPGLEPVVGVTPVRCFPHTDPGEWISLLDPAGREVLCLQDLRAVPAEALALLRAELERREFVPELRRVRDIAPDSEPSVWDVETDRGETRFTLSSEDDVRRLGPAGALVVDSQGVRYRVRDVKALDARSRRLLSRYL
jgi:hypothetical protein